VITNVRAVFSKPGTSAWLLKHELRLALRSLGNKRAWAFAAFFGIVWLLLHALVFFLFYALSKASDAGVSLPPYTMQIAGVMFWLLFTIVLSQTLAHAVEAFFSRGDLDLLLSSPLDAKVVLTIRALGIGFAAILFPALIALPFAHVGIITGRFPLASIYPSTVALALLAAAIGVWLTMLLVQLLGARRAKTATQVLGALIGAGFFLSSQLQNLLSRDTRAALSSWLLRESEVGGMFAPESILWWPGRAFLGEWMPMLTFVVATVIAFWLVVNLTYRRFVLSTQESQTAPGPSQALAGDARIKFASGTTWILLRKEWKLIARDPQVISQTLLQMLYMMPMVFLGISGKSFASLVVPSVVFIVAMLVGNLAWLTVAAEDAPDLVGSSPLALARVRFTKGIAAVVPALVLASPLFFYWLFTKPWYAFVLAFCAIGASINSAACHVLNPRKANRRELNKRGQAHPMSSIVELFSTFGWAGIAYAMMGTWWVLLIAIPVAAVGPIFSYGAGYEARRAGVIA